MKKARSKKETKPFRFITDETAKEVALGLLQNKYFCSDQIHKGASNILHSVFMPLAFMEQKILDDWKEKKVQHLYAPLAKALSWSINGYPCFAECSPLSEADYKVVRAYEKKLSEAVKTALEEPNAKEDKGRTGSKAP